MNNVNLMGRLCGEIELKRTHNGNVCTNFSLAVDRYANGNKTTDFIRCVAWGKTAENIGKFFHKGDVLAIHGSIKTGNFTDRNGNKHYTTDVYVTNFYFTGSKTNPQKSNYQNGNSANYNRSPYPQNSRSSYQNGYYQNPFDGYEAL